MIAWVNSAIIWNTSDQRTKADHFLVVTGIDANKEIVHLNDPGADAPDEQVVGHLHDGVAHRRGVDRRYCGSQLSIAPTLTPSSSRRTTNR